LVYVYLTDPMTGNGASPNFSFELKPAESDRYLRVAILEHHRLKRRVCFHPDLKAFLRVDGPSGELDSSDGEAADRLVRRPLVSGSN
jgi:hypothetical protein